MIHLFTHNDLDGVGCGILAKIAFEDKVMVHYNSVGSLNYQVADFLNEATTKHQIYITDLSVHDENALKLEEFVTGGGFAQFIDHHKTALHLNEFEWASVVVEYEDGRLTSATSLFYEYLVKHHYIQRTKSLDEAVELIRQYDTWEWDKLNNVKAKRLNDLLYMISIEEFEERMLEKLSNDSAFDFDDFETKILDMEEQKLERYLRKKRREIVQKPIDNLWVGIVHAEQFLSELGNVLGKENTHLDYIAMINMGNKRISLRTIHDNIDVSAVARKFDGGGHAKASGCQLNEEAYKLFVEEAFSLVPVKQDAQNNIFNVKESSNGVLYDSKEQGTFFLFPKDNGSWYVENKAHLIESSFSTFLEAEKHIKRNHGAWLQKDEEYVNFLVENIKRLKEK
ncbi:DHH family phosphoesterase [Sutcliffiella rhizosphaerae]|uniref:Oligoribonuclease NrnB n=1 Tax=Sutcliffiella rhizosphaerae TaxID=2880967 RepID=A0ABM8YNV0_9BACI|nr:DHHA1 domain-containing protein [Sutcliffiella rhizosphaerae]CAG9621671.1 Oligoribonuclease NrnB [Sutcliffiella rhizosphaerae]